MPPLSWLRKRRPEVPLDDAGPEMGRAAEIDMDESPGVGPEEAAAAYAALDTLRSSHREVLSLRFLAGLTYEEIARVLDCPVGTVRSRIHYAKAALRAALPDGAHRDAATTQGKVGPHDGRSTRRGPADDGPAG